MNNSGELVTQAERKVRPSTRKPDLDNANVGIILLLWKEVSDRETSFCFFLNTLFSKEVQEMVKINGKELDIAGKTLADYLASTNYDTKRIAVERNGEIVPKATYGETVLKDEDTIEVVSFVGGG